MPESQAFPEAGSPPYSNFGANVRFEPRQRFVPESEQAVLEILRRHPGRNFRAQGRLHAWSPAALGEDLVIDLRRLNSVHIEQRNGQPFAVIGAGCQIKRVLKELERLGGLTLPSLGLITEQALAGAMATATHGSGRSSLSHYAAEFRMAGLDDQGRPVIRTISSGDELRAARCGLGCLGIVLSIGLFVRPQYIVEEHFARHETLESVLRAEHDNPLQQFFLLPWRWDFMGQHRRESSEPRTRLAPLFRLYFSIVFDYSLHLIVVPLARGIRWSWLTRFFFARILGLFVIQNWIVRDRSQAMLTMEHELFRHIEIELFFTRSTLADGLRLVRQLLEYAAGTTHELPESITSSPAATEDLADLHGAYTHHYPICIRRVEPDDALISMTSGDTEDRFAVSLISYERPDQRAGFLHFARVLAEASARLFHARPHWGKVNPLGAAEVERLYPQLPRFREVAQQFDREGQFQNHWFGELLFRRGGKGAPPSA